MMKKVITAIAVFVVLSAGHAAGKASTRDSEVAQIIAGCIETMGGEAAINAFQTLRLEIVYPDHGTDPVLHEFKRRTSSVWKDRTNMS